MQSPESEEGEMHQPRRIGRDRLAVAAMAFLAANLLHSADHVRQDLAGVNGVVFGGGAILTAAAVTVCVATQRDHPRAPLLATVVGFAGAVLVSASHLAPHWSVASDSYVDDIHPDALSWAVMLLEVGAGIALGIVGVRPRRELLGRPQPPEGAFLSSDGLLPRRGRPSSSRP
jgi:hypothetical protein